MNFAWAMDMVLNQERAVRREGWGKNVYLMKIDGIMISQMKGYSHSAIFSPTQRDMRAEDWVEVLEV